MTIKMRTTNGNVYELDEKGAVLDRSNGPRGWNYSGKWIICGFKKRHHSYRTIPLEDALRGEDVGQGWILDLDHGTYRLWGGERLARIWREDAGR